MNTSERIPEFHIGDRLHKALTEAGVSHQDMADFLGVSRNTVGNYIHRRTPVSIGVLRLWALRTGVSLDWLRDGDAGASGAPRDQRDTASAIRSATSSEAAA